MISVQRMKDLTKLSETLVNLSLELRRLVFDPPGRVHE